MTSPRGTVFRTNPNKDFLRRGYDTGHVERLFRSLGRPLKYLGLPAWEMLDILEWDKYLNRFTTIEREENQQHLMFLRANVKDIEHRLYSLYGEFDEILLTGRDQYGKMPEWPYDVVNLDYFGGLLYSDFSRPQAIRKLIRNQATYKSSFLLIVTQHIRDCDTSGEKKSFLDDLRRSLKNSSIDAQRHGAIDRIIDWYAEPGTPDAARQALYLNMLLRDVGEAEYFDVTSRPAILYAGTGGAVMIHFVTDFTFRPGISHKVGSSQPIADVLTFSVREAHDGASIRDRHFPPNI
ncbi:MAG: hypothetical protein ABSA96_19590 [Candidatus Acidiferrales bacterium]